MKSSRSNHLWASIVVRSGLVLALLMTFTSSSLAAPGGGNGKGQHHPVQLGPVEPPHPPTQRHGPASNIKVGRPVDQKFWGIHATDPIDMKVLVITADGQETDFPEIKATLDQIGVPYDVMTATQTTLTPQMLWDGGVHGYYQGIILVTGDLTYYDAATNSWPSAFTDAEWATLWQYESMFGIRQVTSYTDPFGAPDNYGLNLVTYQDTTTTPLTATLTTAGKQIFPYLNPNSPVTFKYAWVYLATVVSPTVTTPLLVTPQGYAIASITKYPDGRQNLAVTAANAPFLVHSLLLSYGVVNWVTKGLFLGERHVNLDTQVDDLLIDDDMWDTTALTDTTGLSFRMAGSDFNAVIAWQNTARALPNAGQLMLEYPFNGEGASGIYSPDTLTPAVIAGQTNFSWVNHTYSHPNLDTITYTLALNELRQNNNVAQKQLKLSKYFKDTMVQPDISGLYNPQFQQAAKDYGIKYMISDTSRQGWNNPSPNAGFHAIYQPSILIIPRRPSNLFYNLSTPDEWVSEYNCYYGPTGTCAGGTWRYWDHNLSYAEILDKESDVWLTYLLKWDIDPLMFHQPNLRAYNGTSSLLGDMINATLAKYNQAYALPIRNDPEHQVGIRMTNRMAYNASGVTARLVPCAGTRKAQLVVKSPASVQAPVTGVAYGNNRETYGGQNISYIQLSANQPVTVTLSSCP